jgi:hypothetical protein
MARAATWETVLTVSMIDDEGRPYAPVVLAICEVSRPMFRFVGLVACKVPDYELIWKRRPAALLLDFVPTRAACILYNLMF